MRPGKGCAKNSFGRRLGLNSNAFSTMPDIGVRRWATSIIGLFLIAAIATLISRVQNEENEISLVSAPNIKHHSDSKNSIHNLQRRVSELMEQVRKAGIEAEKDASERDDLEVQLSKDSHINNPVKATEIRDQVQEQISTDEKDATSAEERRKSLQMKLDKAVNDLADAQLKAFDSKSAVQARLEAREALAQKRVAERQKKASLAKKAAAKAPAKPQSKDSKVDIASLERRVQALTGALEALQKLRASASESGPQGQTYLAQLGQRLITMPEVQKLLVQSLSSKDLWIAEQIAKSLGQNFTSNAPVDPKIMAEVCVGTSVDWGSAPPPLHCSSNTV